MDPARIPDVLTILHEHDDSVPEGIRPTATHQPMAPKRKAAASGAPSKKKKAPPPDWRVPLFYWRGSFDAGFKRWTGTWVASDEGVPTPNDFAESANTFALELAATDVSAPEVAEMEVYMPSFIESAFTTKVEYEAWCKEQQGGRDGGSSETIKALAGSFTGSYKLDNGGGLEDYSDISHEFKSQQAQACVICAAKGTTEFGAFVSMGVLVGSTLTLVRRYIDDKDSRKKQGLEEALDAHAKCADSSAEEFLAKLQAEYMPWKLGL